MSDPVPVEALALRLIAQCWREIEAGWAQIEAARDTMRQTRWMVARWEEQRRAYERGQTADAFRIDHRGPSHAGTYTVISEAKPARRPRDVTAR